jgi:hypothetical protein
MARKTLLNEHEIRKFLKLANITTVGNDKIQEMGGKAYNRDDDPENLKQEEMGWEEEEEEESIDGEDPLAADVAEPEMEMEPELDDPLADDGLEGADEMSLTDEEADAIIDLGDKLRAARDGGEIGDEEVVDMEDDLSDPAPEDELPGVVDDEEAIEMSESEEEETAPKGGDSVLEGASEEDIVAEVARRVTARLQATQRKEQVVDQLAERILNRLTNK